MFSRGICIPLCRYFRCHRWTSFDAQNLFKHKKVKKYFKSKTYILARTLQIISGQWFETKPKIQLL